VTWQLCQKSSSDIPLLHDFRSTDCDQTFLPKNLATGIDQIQSIGEQRNCSLNQPASIMPHPFQCIATVATEGGAYLLAACGPKLLSLSAKDGSIVSQWTSDAAVSIQIACIWPWSGR
jgi:hypothetical protein